MKGTAGAAKEAVIEVGARRTHRRLRLPALPESSSCGAYLAH